MTAHKIALHSMTQTSILILFMAVFDVGPTGWGGGCVGLEEVEPGKQSTKRRTLLSMGCLVAWDGHEASR